MAASLARLRQVGEALLVLDAPPAQGTAPESTVRQVRQVPPPCMTTPARGTAPESTKQVGEALLVLDAPPAQGTPQGQGGLTSEENEASGVYRGGVNSFVKEWRAGGEQGRGELLCEGVRNQRGAGEG